MKMIALVDRRLSGVVLQKDKPFEVLDKDAAVLQKIGWAKPYEASSPTYQTRALTAEQPQTAEAKTETPKADSKVEEEKASMNMSKPELLAMAQARGVEVESDDNKLNLVRKINRYRRRDLRAEE